jgi:hypothetical protein
MTKRLVVLAVAASLALAAQPALARGTRGGGGRPGGAPGGHPGGHSVGRSGGHSGGGYAVPRGSAPAYRPGGAAQARHPQPGRYYYGGAPGRGHYPAYGHGHYPAYGYGRYPAYPYYGYGYRYYPPYYGSSFGLYFGFGGAYGYAGAGWGWPYGYGAYGWGAPYYAPAPVTHVYMSSPDRASEDPDAQAPPSDVRRDSSVPNTGHVRLAVSPADASVYVDDEFWGAASETRRMVLRAGRHSIELVRPGFAVERRELELAPGETSDVTVDMQRR